MRVVIKFCRHGHRAYSLLFADYALCAVLYVWNVVCGVILRCGAKYGIASGTIFCKMSDVEWLSIVSPGKAHFSCSDQLSCPSVYVADSLFWPSLRNSNALHRTWPILFVNTCPCQGTLFATAILTVVSHVIPLMAMTMSPWAFIVDIILMQSIITAALLLVWCQICMDPFLYLHPSFSRTTAVWILTLFLCLNCCLWHFIVMTSLAMFLDGFSWFYVWFFCFILFQWPLLVHEFWCQWPLVHGFYVSDLWFMASMSVTFGSWLLMSVTFGSLYRIYLRNIFFCLSALLHTLLSPWIFMSFVRFPSNFLSGTMLHFHAMLLALHISHEKPLSAFEEISCHAATHDTPYT